MKYIAIDGPGGSGKTYLASTLSARFNARVFHLDEFGNDYEPFVGIPKLIEALSQAHSDVVIFEGVGVFDERFDCFNPFRIFVNTNPDVRRERALSRDVPTRDRSEEEWKKIYEIWREAESTYFTERILKKADLVSDESGTIDLSVVVQAVSQTAE